MTIVVAIRCDSGVVVAADSMMTTFGSEGPLGHHKGKKISVLGGNKISAFAGDLGLGARFSLMAQHTSQDKIDEELDPLDYATQLSEDLVRKFARTGIPTDCQLAAILAFCHRENVCCCEFNSLQPQLLDENLFYTSMGSGTLSTDSFLRFLVDTYCKNQMPSIGKARFLANWAVSMQLILLRAVLRARYAWRPLSGVLRVISRRKNCPSRKLENTGATSREQLARC